MTPAYLAAAAFLASLATGVWAAYDRGQAATRAGLLAAGVALVLLVAELGRRRGDRVLLPAAAIAAALALAVSAYSLLSPVAPLPEDLNPNVAASILVALLPLAAGGLAADLAPAAPRTAWRRVRLLLWTAALAAGLIALLPTGSRGAWLGLAAGALAALFLALRSRRLALRSSQAPRSGPLGTWPLALVGLALAAGAALVLLAGRLPGLDQLLGRVSAASRADLWRDGLVLAGDTPFTGIGLGATMMVYSTYAVLLHVGFITHCHNLLLHVTLEQGLLGLAGLAGLFLAAAWALRGAPQPRPAEAGAAHSRQEQAGAAHSRHGERVSPQSLPQRPSSEAISVVHAGLLRSVRPKTTGRTPLAMTYRQEAGSAQPRQEQAGAAQSRHGERVSPQSLPQRPSSAAISAAWPIAAAAALLALAVHGITDTGVYASRAAALLFAPCAFALACSQQAACAPSPAAAASAQRRAPLAAPLIAALLLAAALLPAGRAAFQANLAAVLQARAELAAYEWPAWPVQDALRRSPEIALDPAIARYRAALSLDARQPAANRRLGQIALSRGEYDAATGLLEAAYAAAPRSRPAQALLGELYAVTGRPDLAAPLLAAAHLGNGAPEGRIWWYDSIGEPQAAQAYRRAAGLP